MPLALRVALTSLFLCAFASPAFAQQEAFVDFDDWTSLCTSFGMGCDAVVAPRSGGMAMLTGDDCAYGQCLETQYPAPGNSNVSIEFQLPYIGAAFYFETMVRLDQLQGGSRARLLRVDDTEAGFELKLSLIAGPSLSIETFDRSTGSPIVVDVVDIALPIASPSSWERIGVHVDSGIADSLAMVDVYVGDSPGPVDGRPVVLYTTGDPRTHTGFDFVRGLGISQADVAELRYAVDDLCISDGPDPRNTYCPTQRGDRPVSMDGGVDGGVDAGDAAPGDSGEPDAAPLDGGGVDARLDGGRGSDLPSFRGSGGCNCHVTSAGSSMRAAWPLALVLARCFRRRRRAR